MAIELTDDGTLDTVLRCSECGEEMRYNYADGPDDDSGTDDGTGSIAAYDAFVQWAIEDAESEHECELADDEPSEPSEDDLTTTDHEVFYQSGKRVLLQEGSGRWYMFDRQHPHGFLLNTLRPGDEMDYRAAIRAYMDRVQFWPNAWFISDHGNAHLIDLSDKEKE